MTNLFAADTQNELHAVMPTFKKRDAFALVAVIIFTAIVMACSAMALLTTESLFNEDIISAERIKIENATAQASALAIAWFRANVEEIAGDRFTLSADLSVSPEYSLPSALFEIIADEYPRYEFSCTMFDLYYDDKYVDDAVGSLPFVAPTVTDDGEIEIAYILSVTVVPDGDSSSYTRTTSLRAIKDTSGDVRVIVVGSSESSSS